MSDYYDLIALVTMLAIGFGLGYHARLIIKKK